MRVIRPTPSSDEEVSDATPLEEDSTGAAEARDTAQRPARADLRAGFVYCLKVFLGVRAGLSVLGLVAVALLPANAHEGLPGWQLIEGPGWSNLFTAWERWDALWFLKIATEGYASGDFSAAFFPLYPLLIRGLSPLLGGHPFAAALLISNVAYLAGLTLFYELSRGEFGHDTARRSVLYMALFPTAYFFVAPYSESVFLALAVGSLLAARRGRWGLAGACGALAAATRSIGLALALPLAIEALLQFRAGARKGRTARLVQSLFWSAFVAAGTAAYLYYWYRNTGDWFTPLSDQNGWLREFSWPWDSLSSGTNIAFEFIGVYSGGYHLLDWLFVVIGLVALPWIALRTRPTYSVYAVVGFVVPLFFVFGGRPFMSFPRFLLVVFPLYWALARFAERFRANDVVVAVSAAGLGAMTLLFVNWYWVF